MMPPVLLPGESDDERRQRRLAAAINSPGFRSSAMGAASPPVNLLPNDEDDRQRRLARISGMMPPVSPQPSSQPASPALPPIGTPPAQPRSDAFAAPSAQSRAALPPIAPPTAAAAQPGAASALPPVPNTATQQSLDLLKQRPPNETLPWWKQILAQVGQALPFGKAVERAIPGSELNYESKLNQTAMRAAKEQMLGKGEQEIETGRAKAETDTPAKRRAFVKANPDLLEGADQFQINDWVATGNKWPGREPVEPKEATDKKIDEYTNDQGQRVLTFQKPNGETYDHIGGKTQPKPAGHTTAFEAFAYGTPEEKKAAQDYLEFEKKAGARYKTPSEFDERYRLFREDPETYKAMFGDKSGAGPDRATATKMLNYFDKRRREIQNDFIDDQQKAQQLQDIEGLEKPFMDAVQPGAAVGPANAGGGPTHPGDKHRVSVIAPDGTKGTVPLRQLKAAKNKGYKVAP
jgi:hypothetical protein